MPDTARLTTALAGRYGLERQLGAGGMATVYLAEDVQHHRQVAIKVLHVELAHTLGAARFLREIEIASQLQHPNILPLLDSGEALGFLYYVMPCVAGHSLRQRLTREGELPVADAVRLLVDVVDALAYAHSHGVIHRDIKPDNVMLSGRHALVTDFGVAKAVHEAATSSADHDRVDLGRGRRAAQPHRQQLAESEPGLVPRRIMAVLRLEPRRAERHLCAFRVRARPASGFAGAADHGPRRQPLP